MEFTDKAKSCEIDSAAFSNPTKDERFNEINDIKNGQYLKFHPNPIKTTRIVSNVLSQQVKNIKN